MNSMTCSVQWLQVTFGGSVTVVVCGPVNGAVWGKTSSASTGKTGGSSISAVPQG
jgi:hypothetical protein